MNTVLLCVFWGGSRDGHLPRGAFPTPVPQTRKATVWRLGSDLGSHRGQPGSLLHRSFPDSSGHPMLVSSALTGLRGVVL